MFKINDFKLFGKYFKRTPESTSFLKQSNSTKNHWNRSKELRIVRITIKFPKNNRYDKYEFTKPQLYKNLDLEFV